MPVPKASDRKPDQHNFLVSAVEPADVEGFVAATLLDARGGRVTLHLDAACAKLLRDLLDEQLL